MRVLCSGMCLLILDRPPEELLPTAACCTDILEQSAGVGYESKAAYLNSSSCLRLAIST